MNSLRNQRLQRLGTGVTIFYLSFLVGTVYGEPSAFSALKLNELGDFLAGSMAPLAFLWLVLGYFQQGEELQLNTEALKAQQRELAEQVRATNEMAQSAGRQAVANEELASASRRETAARELKEQLEAQPIFRIKGYSPEDGEHRFAIRNDGQRVTGLRVIAPEGAQMGIAKDELPNGVITTMSIRTELEYPYEFSIEYVDGLRKKYRVPCTMQKASRFEMRDAIRVEQ